jgi:hypothetical protein
MPQQGTQRYPVALDQTALDVLNRQHGKHEQFVFSYKGQGIGQVRHQSLEKGTKAS